MRVACWALCAAQCAQQTYSKALEFVDFGYGRLDELGVGFVPWPNENGSWAGRYGLLQQPEGLTCFQGLGQATGPGGSMVVTVASYLDASKNNALQGALGLIPCNTSTADGDSTGSRCVKQTAFTTFGRIITYECIKEGICGDKVDALGRKWNYDCGKKACLPEYVKLPNQSYFKVDQAFRCSDTCRTVTASKMCPHLNGAVLVDTDNATMEEIVADIDAFAAPCADQPTFRESCWVMRCHQAFTAREGLCAGTCGKGTHRKCKPETPPCRSTCEEYMARQVPALISQSGMPPRVATCSNVSADSTLFSPWALRYCALAGRGDCSVMPESNCANTTPFVDGAVCVLHDECDSKSCPKRRQGYHEHGKCCRNYLDNCTFLGECNSNATCDCYLTPWFKPEAYGETCVLLRTPAILWAAASLGVAILIASFSVCVRLLKNVQRTYRRRKKAKKRLRGAMSRVLQMNKDTRRSRAKDHFHIRKLRDGWTANATNIISAFKAAAPIAASTVTGTHVSAVAHIKDADGENAARRYSSSSDEDEEVVRKREEDARIQAIMEAQKAEWAKQFKDQVEISMYNKEQDGEDMFGDSRADQAHAWGEKKKEKVVVKSAFANVVAGMGGHMSAEAAAKLSAMTPAATMQPRAKASWGSGAAAAVAAQAAGAVTGRSSS